MFLIVFLTGKNCCHWPEVGAKNRILDNILLIDKSAIQDPHRPKQTQTDLDGALSCYTIHGPSLPPYTLPGHPPK